MGWIENDPVFILFQQLHLGKQFVHISWLASLLPSSLSAVHYIDIAGFILFTGTYA
jgi:hypothetical protein